MQGQELGRRAQGPARGRQSTGCEEGRAARSPGRRGRAGGLGPFLRERWVLQDPNVGGGSGRPDNCGDSVRPAAGGGQGPWALSCGPGGWGLSGPTREWVRGPPQPCLPHCKKQSPQSLDAHRTRTETYSICSTKCHGAIRKKCLPGGTIMGQAEEQVYSPPVSLPGVSPGSASSRKPSGPRVWALLHGRCWRRGLTSVQQGRVLAQGPQAVERAQPLEHRPQRGGHGGLVRQLVEFPHDRELQERQGQGAAPVHLKANAQGHPHREPRPGTSCPQGS